jgi:S-(hydroxymethyl)mycothiol dehydrogenase
VRTSSSTPSASRTGTSRRSRRATSPDESVLVGVPDPGTTITLPLDEVFGRGGSLKSAWYGDALPSRDFPMLVDQYRLGRLDLDAFVTERIGLGDVEAAFDKMQHGSVLRSVVEL